MKHELSNYGRGIVDALAYGQDVVVKSKDADAIMLNTGGQIMSRGKLLDITWKRLSPGTGRLSLKEIIT